jgi:hypothetical protein
MYMHILFVYVIVKRRGGGGEVFGLIKMDGVFFSWVYVIGLMMAL